VSSYLSHDNKKASFVTMTFFLYIVSIDEVKKGGVYADTPFHLYACIVNFSNTLKSIIQQHAMHEYIHEFYYPSSLFIYPLNLFTFFVTPVTLLHILLYKKSR